MRIWTPLKNVVSVMAILLGAEACRTPTQADHSLAPRAGISHAGSAETQNGRQLKEIVKMIYLGQLYPSGRVYLRSFREDASKKQGFWPARVRLTSLVSKSANATKSHDAVFSEVLSDDTTTTVVQRRYIPGFERMDSEHEACDIGSKATKSSKFVYEAIDGVPDEFFDAILDHCETNDGIAVYNVRPNERISYSVIAVPKTLVFRSIERNLGRKRPLAEDEKSVVERAKADIDTEECNTVPRFLDKAMVIFSAQIHGTSSSIRISHYETPGCAGHLASVYILDILAGKNVFDTYEFIQYRGAL